MTHPDDRYTDLYHRATSRALREVADDLVSGRIPTGEVFSFGDLHDHVDANEYGGLTGDNAVIVNDPADIGIANAVQSTVSVLLRATVLGGLYHRVATLRTAADHLEHPYRSLVPAAPPTYDDLSEDDRRAIVDFVLETGRDLDSRDEWSMEDNFSTTEGLAGVYDQHVKRKRRS